MRKVFFAFAALGGALSGAATAGDLEESLAVPSGYALSLQEVIYETRQDNSNVARFRYVMPIIGQEGITFDDVEADFLFLCEVHARKSVENAGLPVDQIIISLSDRETEFGTVSLVATQFFEAYRIEGDACIWEGF